MGCINKSDKSYKALNERYGDTIAEAIVRKMSKDKGLDEEFYIPSILEARKFLSNSNINKLQKIQRGLKVNPFMSEKGIVDYLQGVIAKRGDKYFIVKGWDVGIIQTASNLKEIFKPNLIIIKNLVREYPDIFKLIDTNKETVKIVEINPRLGVNKPISSVNDIKPEVEELFESNPELAKIGTQEQYSQYLDTIFPDSKVAEMDNSLYISVLNQLEQENIIEKDCTGKLKAEKGLQTNFTKGGEWKLIKDLKGYPTHKEGGVDLTIDKNGVSIKNGNTQFIAKHGLVIPKN